MAARHPTDSGRSGHGPSDSQELRAHDTSFSVDVRHSEGMHLAGQSEGIAALGRLSLDGIKLGVRDRDYLLTASSKHSLTSATSCRKRHVY